ncbi:MAG: ferredoxin-type protein NapG [Deferribacteres bacterium]|jgi:ferredoxin-type protein NapG|nr:nitrate reductase [Deferribacteraceae bacterium]MDK2793209.1 ferredoxin-type protein NapG [Deferribacteres bacterium]
MNLKERLQKTLSENPFKGFFKKNRLRPPGARGEKQFMELCIRCARCIEVCPYDSIKRADLFEKLQIGTPYIFPEDRACYLCMKCPEVCPTGALDNKLFEPEKVNIGKAVISQEDCLNFIYFKEEETGKITGKAMICSTCYNVCPFTDEAIVMEKYILPVITEKCVGCGICVEKCPVKTTDGKAVNVVPTGMGNEKDAGYYYRRSKILKSDPQKYKDILKGDKLIEKKQNISTFGEKKQFKYDFEINTSIEGWEMNED